MFLDEILQQGNQVIRTGGNGSVIQLHLTGRFTVSSDHHAGGKAIAVHVFIVADIILGHDKCLFSFRKKDLSFFQDSLSIFIGGLIGDVMKAYQYESLVIHGLQDF